MRHAVIIISCLGLDYLENNLKQFEGDKDIDIYIHVDKQTDADLNDKKVEYNFLKKNKNVKYCKHLFNCERYSFNLAYVSVALLNKAYTSNKNYGYYHIFSETCYLIASLEEFKDFFERHKGITFCPDNLTHDDNSKKYLGYNVYESLQFMSLYSGHVSQIIDDGWLFKVANDFKEFQWIFNKPGKEKPAIGLLHAMDEMLIQTALWNDENIDKTYLSNCQYKYMKFVSGGHARVNKLSEIAKYEDIDYALNRALSTRKIDYKNKDSWAFLELLRKNHNFIY